MTLEAGIIYIAIGFALGGILKGATGAGAPIIAVPLIAIYYDVPFAIAVFIMPNVVLNGWQMWTCRAHHLALEFPVRFAGAGAIGTVVGTVILGSFSSDSLKAIVAVAVMLYIFFRLLRPDWMLGYKKAVRMAVPVGGIAGVLQGASGLSAPISISFLNSMRLDRLTFIPTISTFFLATVLVQIPMLYGYGFLSWERFWLSCAATVLMLIFMPIGVFLSRHVSRQSFDRIILVILTVLAIRLLVETLG